MQRLRRIARDLRHRRHIEVYVVVVASIALAVLSLFGDLVSDEVRWAVVLAALGLLTYQITLPDRPTDLDHVLHDRAAFDDVTLSSRWRGAREVWIFGPSVAYLLTAEAASHLRSHVLARQDGVVRVLVLDPEEQAAVELAGRQLDQATAFPIIDLAKALAATIGRLEMMARWDTQGAFEHRFAPFNPGFSVLAIDPYGKAGSLIVEFHGLHNEANASRMHIELTRAKSEHWFGYWRDQFEQLWDIARCP
jgi:hypothetical protein